MALAAAFETRACIGWDTFGVALFVPNPQSCNAYVLCYNGEAHAATCPPGYQFDVGAQNCANHGGVDCTQCAPIGNVQLPHPSDCSAFYECSFGTRTARNCPPGFMFDKTIGSCNSAHLVVCPGGPGGPGAPAPGM